MHNLPITEELDFHYLLGLLPPLQNEEEFAWLPELFSTVTDDSISGYQRLVRLCRFAGGETIKIPTVDQLADSIAALQVFYDVYIVRRKPVAEIPVDLQELVVKIKHVYDAK